MILKLVIGSSIAYFLFGSILLKEEVTTTDPKLIRVYSDQPINQSFTILLRSFIPNEMLSNPEYIFPVPGSTGRSMIKAPEVSLFDDLEGKCFMTDHRGFSNSLAASAKATTKFKVTITDSSVTLTPSSVNDIHTTSNSVLLDCTNGKEISVKAGTFSTKAIGNPIRAGDQVQIIGQVAVKNPHITMAPFIDYSFDFIYNSSTKKLTYRIDHGIFPAFEVYVYNKNGVPTTLAQVAPSAETAFGLIDSGLGLNMNIIQGEVTIN